MDKCCLENCLAHCHIFDPRVLIAAMLLNHKQKTHQATTCYAH